MGMMMEPGVSRPSDIVLQMSRSCITFCHVSNIGGNGDQFISSSAMPSHSLGAEILHIYLRPKLKPDQWLGECICRIDF